MTDPSIRSAEQRLPSGTVTFLFTDIEGSTRLLQQLGEKYASLLAEQQQLVREACEKHEGSVVGTQGDSFFVAFSNAVDAIHAVVQSQRALAHHTWPDGANVRVRMGLHTGEAQISSSDYVGIDVHRAARIAAAAHGGQVLLSQATGLIIFICLAGTLILMPFYAENVLGYDPQQTGLLMATVPVALGVIAPVSRTLPLPGPDRSKPNARIITAYRVLPFC